MKINSTTDYAVRILVYLGSTGRITSSGEIAKVMSIPSNYVPNIIKKLRDTGLVVARYGPKGGYELGRPAEEITLLEIVQTMEGPVRINRCEDDAEYLRLNEAAHRAAGIVYSDIQKQIEALLSGYTIKDLCALSEA